jgi:hypothetical protein
MAYDRNKPFTAKMKFFNTYLPKDIIQKPKAYIIPQGWYEVITRLKVNGVKTEQMKADTVLDVTRYRIESYKSLATAYEKHHKNYAIKTTSHREQVHFLKGDHIVYLNQPSNRYIIEMLEPTGDDGFFSWNFFDGILQQKEGYSDYRWEDLAAEVLQNDPELKNKVEAKKAEDPKFAASATAILDFIYKNSKYYEKAHMNYPVYRLEN